MTFAQVNETPLQSSPSTGVKTPVAPVQVASASPLLGQPAPAFSLPDQNDKTRTLAESKGKWTVLAFYPKDETSGCTLQNKSYSAAKEKFGTQNAVFYTVSTQDSASKRAFCAKDALTHTLLADVGGTVAKQYGVYMPNNGLAKRVTFYIAPDGTVADVDQQIKVATAAEDSLKRLAALQASYKPAGVSAAAPAAVAGPPKAGQPVPQFSLPNPATGSVQSLKDLSAGKKATVVIFVATQCPVSNAYNARMAQIASAYASKGVQFVGINSNKQEAGPEVVSHAKENKLTFPILKDPNNKIADQYDAKVTPEVFVVDAKGNLAFHGPIDDSQDVPDIKKQYLRDTLDSLTQGRAVAVTGARAFGCTIKRVGKS
jgi:peroxiredoxin